MTEDKVVKPRCPQCQKVVADWLKGKAGYTCPRCHLTFTLDTVKKNTFDTTPLVSYDKVTTK